MVDSGFWPENPSFSDRNAAGKLVYHNIPHWKGKCHPAEAFNASNCNQKVIGARYYNTGFGGPAAVKARYPNDFNSPRDGSGHGSHTASTAGGNSGVHASIDGVDLGTISGMAPRARLSIYKTCYGDGATSACFTSDSVAAIDQAVADGVDVINYSVSGSTNSNVDPVEVAFLFAADAGVFVANSAGNAGPTASTVAHNSPWIMTVAAGTHDRFYTASVTRGDGIVHQGSSLGSGTPSLPVILASGCGVARHSRPIRFCSAGPTTRAEACYLRRVRKVHASIRRRSPARLSYATEAAVRESTRVSRSGTRAASA